MIIGGFGSGKTNTLLNLINEQHDIDKIHWYTKNLNKAKYEILIEKRKDAGIEHLNDPNGFTECSNMMNDVYENIHDYNSSKKRKILIVFYDMIADIMKNKKFQAIIKELFIRCRKLNTSLVFITQSYFSVPKDVRLNSAHYLIMKINNKIKLQKIAINHSADIDYSDFIKIYRECRKEPNNFLTIETTLPTSDPLRFRILMCLKTLVAKQCIKITITDQIKILDRKIMLNEAQYDLDRKATKVSALTSNNLDKYEYLTGQDLGLKLSNIEQAKFEYSPLSKIFNKGLNKDDKKEGLFKRLKNIKDKNEEQLQAIKNQGEKQLKELKNIDKSKTLKAVVKISKKMTKQTNYCLNLGK